MRRYAKDRMIVSISAQQLEPQLRKDYPKASPSWIRKTAKAIAMEAYKQLKTEGK